MLKGVRTQSPAELLAQVRAHGRVPRHIAIIMDGNGRWARERFMPRTFGHRSGMTSVRDVIEGSIEAGIEYLSLFAFSQENWDRPADEVGALMSLLEEYVEREADELHSAGVCVRVLGDLTRLTAAAGEAVGRVTGRTARNDRLILNLFISYGSRDEIVRAARALATDVVEGRLAVDDIDADRLGARLYTAGCPDPDLLVRTSGEQRISNFLLWQLAYSELYLSPVLWPDFTRSDLYDAILSFQARERRFGRVSV
ncbi:MAG: Ditrans,polycis-undecaprenyl-diphosphate synthase ((2E,6E)-farnesyl-diphosphate specific) [Gemmatimonadaceae bacterium]|nr:Ditrans,polycis-undecaprenyl-diphosphate synthase ((2E,6E)-farnesyl-diphosphate specific) [Gemmatimonadaceae bacterium]